MALTQIFLRKNYPNVSVTLDYLCEQLGIIPNAIKIDTDGNEDTVLEGAVKNYLILV
ncbi:MAG: hypothetical protein NUV74_18950 [Candidatus Brocadiaceae bacterium]|nr:hypothetical protein [Candidatus Brocadiaceae bacterium]